MEEKKNLIQQHNKLRLQAALSRLEPYITLTQNNNRRFQSGIGLQISDQFDDVSMKRTSLFKSTVTNSNFLNSALTGSCFSETTFRNSVFDESNLQYCHFIHSTFCDVRIHSTNLSYSSFFGTNFKQTLFKGSTVSELLFDTCSFEDCVFTASMLENAIFTHCTLKNVRFVNTNIEFMEFKECEFQDVTMPFQQLPYVYGLYAYLSDGGVQAEAGDTCLTAEEYLALQEDLIVYYASVNEYFPMTNLYLVRQELDAAYQCISLGLQASIASKNFRMLKFFCKLAVQGALFPHQKLRELYTIINTYVKKQALNIYEQRDFIHNSAEIRSLLLDSVYDCPTARIELQTNIDSNEPEKVIQFIEYLDHTIRGICSQQISHIEYRHNSDSNFIAFISANYQEILLTIFILYKFANTVSEQMETRIMNWQTIRLNRQKLKKEKLKQTEHEGERLKDKGIKYEINFYIDNVNINDSHDDDLYL